MPAGGPPPGVKPFPRYLWLPAGSFLWKVVGGPGVDAAATGAPGGTANGRAAATSRPVFRPPPTGPDPAGWQSGRFDPTPDCPYPHCYAALDDLTALCDGLLRDVGSGAPLRYLPRRTLAGRSLVLLETSRPLCLVSLLDAADLAAACQDTWLVHAEEGDYSRTQRWAHWLYEGALGPDGAGPPAGLVWPSKRQPTGRSVLLFGDRCADAVAYSSLGERQLDDAEGLAWLGRRLSLLRTRLGPPSPVPPSPLGPALAAGGA
jgi:hypothetical protein